MENGDLEGCCLDNIKEFEKNNEALLNNKIMSGFLEVPLHKQIYSEAICTPTEANKKYLDKVFKEFYFNIRFTSHISSTLYFNAINFDKRYRKISNRYPITADASIGDGENTSFKDLISDEQALIKIDEVIKSDCITEYVACPNLYEAILSLSKTQREIINMAYLHGYSDTEIGKILNKSQQAISKTHKKALKKLITFFKDKEANQNDNGFS